MSVGSKMTAIANAIRTLLGTGGTLTLDGMAAAVGGITKKAAASYTPGTAEQTIAAGQYLSGPQTVQGDANLIPANVAAGVSIFGVAGTHEGGATNVKRWDITLASVINNSLALVSGDPDIMAHRTDATAKLLFQRKNSSVGVYHEVAFCYGGNVKYSGNYDLYQVGVYQSSSGLGFSSGNMPISSEYSYSDGFLFTAANGDVCYGANASRMLYPGDWVLLFMW